MHDCGVFDDLQVYIQDLDVIAELKLLKEELHQPTAVNFVLRAKKRWVVVVLLF